MFGFLAGLSFGTPFVRDDELWVEVLSTNSKYVIAGKGNVDYPTPLFLLPSPTENERTLGLVTLKQQHAESHGVADYEELFEADILAARHGDPGGAWWATGWTTRTKADETVTLELFGAPTFAKPAKSGERRRVWPAKEVKFVRGTPFVTVADDEWIPVWPVGIVWAEEPST